MNDKIEYLENKGYNNPLRSINLVERAIEFNQLNLSNLIVFTEAASNEFIYTPIIAAMAGAKKVYAIASTSKYAVKEEVAKDTLLFAELCGVNDKIEVVFDKERIKEADIITNLGFVRPINRETIDIMKKGAVIPYMCEAWEIREQDVDINYCKEKGISVMGTNENYLGLDVFNFSGMLSLKMLLDCGIEVYKSKIVILSSDKFGKVIYETLSLLCEDVALINDIDEDNEKILKNADALIVADYTSSISFIGKINSSITAKRLKQQSKFITVIQFAGIVDIDDLIENDITFYPKFQVGSFRMGKTLAYLGPKPIIDLHCAGLKVGELMHKNIYEAKNHKLCQAII